MTGGNDWERFFDGHAPVYMENLFTANTAAEIEFLMVELALAPGARVLDVGCGTGRHSVPLAALGMRVTGVDISAGMLERARAAAAEAGVDVEWVKSDVSKALPAGPFDAVICLCEGAFGLLGEADDPEDHDLAILRNIRGALAPGGRLVLTALNATRMIRQYDDDDVEAGRFDPRTLVEQSELDEHLPEGAAPVRVRERAFTPPELDLMLRVAGFDVEHIWGGTAGAWNRGDVKLDEMEIMAVARRRA